MNRADTANSAAAIASRMPIFWAKGTSEDVYKRQPEGSSVREHARSELRKRFYSFATEEVGRGYVHEEEGSFEALFPHLPKNTEEMHATTLYTEAVYPVTRNASGSFVMHAWAGCPVAVGAGSFGSIAQMEAGSYPVCDRCEFTAASMGRCV